MKTRTHRSRLTTPSSRNAPLAMDAKTFRGLGHRLVDVFAGYLE